MNTRICSKQTRYIEGQSGFIYSLHALLSDILPGLLVERCWKIEDRQSLWSSQIHQLSAVLMSPCDFLFAVRIEKFLPLPLIYGHLPWSWQQNPPSFLVPPPGFSKKYPPVWHFPAADLCTRSAKQEQRVFKQLISPQTHTFHISFVPM